jgi:hypothetical protein
MTNIHNAICKANIAARAGRISAEVQARILRKLNPSTEDLRWQSMRKLQAEIHKDIAPKLEEKRKVEREVLDIEFTVPTKRAYVSRARAKLPRLTDYEFTPAWWAEAGKREAAQRKLVGAAMDE